MNKEQTFKYFLAIYIALITFFIYTPSLQNDFVNWDDGMYVYANYSIRKLNFSFLKWASYNFYAANWHPLTWVSHAIDYKLWGSNALGHHLTSIVLHGLNTLLVVMLITRLLESFKDIKIPEKTSEGVFSHEGILTTAGITGLLFGLHPIHVESVAWISERKDVLYAFFYLLSLLMYIRYLKEMRRIYETGALRSAFSSWNYRSAIVLFVLSLMSKPMAVTLPVVMVILDWYPFRRFELGRLTPLLVEKLPFLLLSLGSAIITILAQHSGGAMQSLTVTPISVRILVGLKSLIDYLAQMIYPINLSPFHPYPQNTKMVTLLSYEYLVSLILLISITTTLIIFSKRQKLWSAVCAYYIVTILPVLGIIKVGSQAMADRYTYLPSIGPFFLVGLAAGRIIGKCPTTSRIVKKSIFLFFVVLLFSALSYATIRQTHIWGNSETLWNKVIADYPNHPLAYNNRGEHYRDAEHYEKALNDFTQGISIQPDYFPLYINRARVYLKLGRFDDSLNDVREAMKLSPDNWQTYLLRAQIHAAIDRDEEALEDYTKVIKLKPGLHEAYNGRGLIYAKLGLLEEAINDYTHAINLSPPFQAVYYYYNRGVLYKLIGQPEKALKDFRTSQNIRNDSS